MTTALKISEFLSLRNTPETLTLFSWFYFLKKLGEV